MRQQVEFRYYGRGADDDNDDDASLFAKSAELRLITHSTASSSSSFSDASAIATACDSPSTPSVRAQSNLLAPPPKSVLNGGSPAQQKCPMASDSTSSNNTGTSPLLPPMKKTREPICFRISGKLIRIRAKLSALRLGLPKKFHLFGRFSRRGS